jgi:phospholipid/cholesterol/gamma-HCH transport system substrate-binding protein
VAEDLSSRTRASSRRFAGFSLIVALLAVIVIALVLRRPSHSLRLRVCFHDVNGLKAGAAVRIAGVEVGVVQSVRAQPMNSTCPADVAMEIATDYAISLPSDAVAAVDNAGILGPSYVAIDASHASASPVANGGQIRSQESPPVAANLEHSMERFLDHLEHKSDEQKSITPCPQTPTTATKAPPKPIPN